MALDKTVVLLHACDSSANIPAMSAYQIELSLAWYVRTWGWGMRIDKLRRLRRVMRLTQAVIR